MASVTRWWLKNCFFFVFCFVFVFFHCKNLSDSPALLYIACDFCLLQSKITVLLYIHTYSLKLMKHKMNSTSSCWMISACCWFSVAFASSILSLVWQRASRSDFIDWGKTNVMQNIVDEALIYRGWRGIGGGGQGESFLDLLYHYITGSILHWKLCSHILS